MGVGFWKFYLSKRGSPVAEQPPAATAPAPTAVTVAAPTTGWIVDESIGSLTVASYIADFKNHDRPIEFSRGAMSLTKAGKRPYLGPFNEAGVTFSLDKTPPHHLIHLVFDLALLNSWNGSNAHWGPDIWKAQTLGGRQLLSATFCNCGFFSDNNEQSYPDLFPSPADVDPHVAWTGAAEHETLGEIRTFYKNSNPPSGDASSVYHMDWTFPHSDDRLNLKFTSHVKDKGMKFGFLSFTAEAIGDFVQLDDQELKSDWAQLNGDDPVSSDQALWRLAATGNQAVEFLKNQPAALASAGYQRSRIMHLLTVIDTPQALEFLAAMKGSEAAKISP